MDKQKKRVSHNKKQVHQETKSKHHPFLKESECIKASIKPANSFIPYGERLLEITEKLRSMVFGLTYDTETGKTLKREKTSENLVTALCNLEKYVKGVINEQLDHIGLLKLIIERDAPFLVCDDEYILGVKRDRSGLSLPQKNKIAFQAAAQVLWYLQKNKIPNIKEMEDELRNKKKSLSDLLEIKRFSKRTIEDWICSVFPIPKHLRKGRPANSGVSEKYFNKLIPIPEVILDNGKMINFLKLRFVILCFSRVLRTLNWSKDQIEDSIFIQIYKPYLTFDLWICVKCWICTAVVENGSIFDA